MGNISKFNFVVVGAGFYGCVIAERIASDIGQPVLVIDKRAHIGGNCYSEIEPQTGIEYHKYGTHIFHTSNKKVWDYINRFCEFNGYRHQVLSNVDNKVYQMPVNLETINTFYNINLKPFEVAHFAKQQKWQKYSSPKNFMEAAINLFGEELYYAFIHGYTQKQWGRDPKLIPQSIAKRLIFRTNYNESYYDDTWQGIPLHGYSDIFAKLLSNEKIHTLLNTGYNAIKRTINQDATIIYSGPIDNFFEYKFGHLEWRSLRFVNEIKKVEDFQGNSVMNYPSPDVTYTRIHEPKHLHTERQSYLAPETLTMYEYPCNNNEEPYYPVGDEKSNALLKKYQNEAKKLPHILLGGRMGAYKYQDMDKTILNALNDYEKIKILWKKRVWH